MKLKYNSLFGYFYICMQEEFFEGKEENHLSKAEIFALTPACFYVHGKEENSYQRIFRILQNLGIIPDDLQYSCDLAQTNIFRFTSTTQIVNMINFLVSNGWVTDEDCKMLLQYRAKLNPQQALIKLYTSDYFSWGLFSSADSDASDYRLDLCLKDITKQEVAIKELVAQNIPKEHIIVDKQEFSLVDQKSLKSLKDISDKTKNIKKQSLVVCETFSYVRLTVHNKMSIVKIINYMLEASYILPSDALNAFTLDFLQLSDETYRKLFINYADENPEKKSDLKYNELPTSSGKNEMEQPPSTFQNSVPDKPAPQALPLFKQFILNPEDEQGYALFQIKRIEAYQLMDEKILNIDGLIRPAVEEALMDEIFIRYLEKNKKVTTPLVQAYATYKQNNVTDNLFKFAGNLIIQRAYLDYDVRDKEIKSGWSHPCVFKALAHLQNIDLYFWQKIGSDQFVLHPHYQLSVPKTASTVTLDLLIMNDYQLIRLEKQPEKALSVSTADAKKDIIVSSHFMSLHSKFEEKPVMKFTEQQHLAAAFSAIELGNIKLLEVLLGDEVTKNEIQNFDKSTTAIAYSNIFSIIDKIKEEAYGMQLQLLKSFFYPKGIQAFSKEDIAQLKQCFIDAREKIFNEYMCAFEMQKGVVIYDKETKQAHYYSSLLEIEQWLRNLVNNVARDLSYELSVISPHSHITSGILEAHLAAMKDRALGGFEYNQDAQLNKHAVVDQMRNDIKKKRDLHRQLGKALFEKEELIPEVYRQLSPDDILDDLTYFRLSPNACNEKGESLVYCALKKNNMAAKVLLEHDADIDLKLGDGQTAWEKLGVSRRIVEDMKAAKLSPEKLQSRYQQGVNSFLEKYNKKLQEREQRIENSLFWRLFDSPTIIQKRRLALTQTMSALKQSEVGYNDDILYRVIQEVTAPARSPRGFLGRSEFVKELLSESENYAKDSAYGINEKRTLDLLLATQEQRQELEQAKQKLIESQKEIQENNMTITKLKNEKETLAADNSLLRDENKGLNAKNKELESKLTTNNAELEAMKEKYKLIEKRMEKMGDLIDQLLEERNERKKHSESGRTYESPKSQP